MHYRKALEAELSGRLCFNEPNVLRRLQVDAVSDSFCSSCYASIRDDPDLSLHLKTLVALVADAEKPEGHRDEDLMYEPLVCLAFHYNAESSYDPESAPSSTISPRIRTPNPTTLPVGLAHSKSTLKQT